jgi:hypothetical protein
VRGRIRYLIYALAAYALYRLWPTRGFVWWTLLASALLTLWTAAMLKTAVKRRAAGDLAAALNPRLSVPGSAQGPTGVVRYWLRWNVALCTVTVALSIWAIAVSG